MGSTWTFFSQRYLNSSFGWLNSRDGVMKLPKMLELNTGFGFLSLPITTWHCHGSEILPIWNEFALNSTMIPILGFRVISLGTTVK